MANRHHTLEQDIPTDSDATSFGELLRQLREGYPERVSRNRPRTALAFAKLSQAGLVKCLELHRVSISQGLYSEIENDKSLPPEPKQFLAAVSACLELDERDVDRLVRLLGFRIISDKLGRDRALRAFPPAP